MLTRQRAHVTMKKAPDSGFRHGLEWPGLMHLWQEDKKYCPDEKTLQDMRTMAVWAEGVAGKVHLQIKSVSATGCSEVEWVGAKESRRGLRCENSEPEKVFGQLVEWLWAEHFQQELLSEKTITHTKLFKPLQWKRRLCSSLESYSPHHKNNWPDVDNVLGNQLLA